jgi:hypothetical protein
MNTQPNTVMNRFTRTFTARNHRASTKRVLPALLGILLAVGARSN